MTRAAMQTTDGGTLQAARATFDAPWQFPAPVRGAPGASDRRPVVTESDGPDWGYHDCDVNLALGNLLAANATTEATRTRSAHR